MSTLLRLLYDLRSVQESELRYSGRVRGAYLPDEACVETADLTGAGMIDPAALSDRGIVDRDSRPDLQRACPIDTAELKRRRGVQVGAGLHGRGRTCSAELEHAD